MTELDRIKLVVTFLINKGIAKSRKEIGQILGYTNESSFSQLLNGKVSIPKNFIKKLVALDESINQNWLMTGDGEMLKNGGAEERSVAQSKPTESVLTGKLIPFYDAEAAAGTEYGMSMEPARQVGMIEIGSVLRDSESAIRVYGNSMVPNYPAGCVIGLKLHTDSFIEPGHVYVVETRDNRYLKRLYYTDDRASFHCISDNQMKFEDGPRQGKLYYQDFEIPLNEVIRLHRVVGVIKRNIL